MWEKLASWAKLLTDAEGVLLYIFGCFLFAALMGVLSGMSEARPWALVWAAVILTVVGRSALRRRRERANE